MSDTPHQPPTDAVGIDDQMTDDAALSWWNVLQPAPLTSEGVCAVHESRERGCPVCDGLDYEWPAPKPDTELRQISLSQLRSAMGGACLIGVDAALTATPPSPKLDDAVGIAEAVTALLDQFCAKLPCATAHDSGLFIVTREDLVELLRATPCVHCGQPEAAHEPSGCCGDGGGSVFETMRALSPESGVERELAELKASMAYRHSLIGRTQAEVERLREALEAARGQILLHHESGDDRAGYRLAPEVLQQINAALNPRTVK